MTEAHVAGLTDTDWMWSGFLTTELGIPYFEAEVPGLRYTALKTWLCTDTEVGFGALTWKGKLVAFTYCPSRKSDTNYYWVSEKVALEVAKAVLELAPFVDVENMVDTVDWDLDIDKILATYPPSNLKNLL